MRHLPVNNGNYVCAFRVISHHYKEARDSSDNEGYCFYVIIYFIAYVHISYIYPTIAVSLTG